MLIDCIEGVKLLRLSHLIETEAVGPPQSKYLNGVAEIETTLSPHRLKDELHAIEAVISGQGIAICSDVLVAPELASGALVQVSKLTLPGYRFYLLYRSEHPKLASISAFTTWARSMQNNIR